MTLLATLTDPESFFEQRSSDLSLLTPTGVVLLVAVLGALSSLLLTMSIMDSFSVPATGTLIMYVVSTIPVVVLSIIFWVLFTVAFYLLSTKLYDGDGSFKETLAMTGWGHTPQILTGVLSVAVVYYMLFVQGVSGPQVESLQAIQQYTQAIRTKPLFQLSSVLGIVGVLWSGYIWISGLATVQQIEESDAFVAVGIPVALFVAWSLFNLL